MYLFSIFFKFCRFGHSKMFSALNICRKLAARTTRVPRAITVNLTKPNIRYIQTTKIVRNKNAEPGEAIKWVLLMFPVASFGLGCWQVYRLQWKLELIDILYAKTNSTPVDMPQDFNELENLEFRPVKVRGEFLHDKEILIGPRSIIENDTALPRTGSLLSNPDKNQGYLVITPFKLSDSGEVILVNRGWIPKSLRPKAKRQDSMVNGEIELTGIVRLTEKRTQFMPKNIPEKGAWFYRDLDQMSEHIGCAPVWLDAKGIPDPPPGWPIPNQTRVTLRNEHLSYLITWYLLSVFTALMWHRYFIRKLPLL